MREYREYPPPPALRGLAPCAWRATVRGGSQHVQRVVPDGCMDLIWTGTELMVAGPDTGAFLIPQAPGSVVTGLRFAPGVAPTLLRTPASAVRDQRMPLAELDRASAQLALAQLEQGMPSDQVLAGVALRAVRETGAPEHGPRRAAAMLRAGTGVASTAAALGCGTRTLHRWSKTSFGYGPATLRRVLRFRDALELARRGVPGAEVAARAGYADQAHLSREVRALAGVPLRELLAG